MNRALRLAVGFVPIVALWLFAALGEHLEYHAGRGFFRLRDWMDCPR